MGGAAVALVHAMLGAATTADTVQRVDLLQVLDVVVAAALYGWTATFVALGLASPAALGGVLLYRVLSFWLPTAAGVIPAVVSVRAARPALGVTLPVARRVAA